MIKFNSRFPFVLALISSVACSGPVDEAFDMAEALEDGAVLDEYGELAQLEQAYNAPVTVNSQFGTQTGSDRGRCNRTSSGQVCSVPSFHNISYCAQNAGFTPALGTESRIHVLMNAMDSLLTTRTVSQPLDLFGICDATAANVLFSKAAVGTSGTASNDIKNYSTNSFDSPVALTEVGLPGEPAVVGQYQKHVRCIIGVDETDIFAKGTNATQDQRYLDHAVVNALSACLGKGRVSGVSAFNRATSRDMSSTHANDTFTAGELCQLNAYNAVNNGNFANSGNCGND